MSDVRWIKIIVDIFDDEKIRLIETLPDADTILIIWFKLLALAGKCNDNGVVYLTRDIPYNEEMLSTIMRRQVNTVRLALNEFQKLEMIKIENNFIALLNWEKHQSIEKLEKIKNDTRVRVQKHRERQKTLCNVSVTQCNAIEEEKKEEIEEEIGNGKKKKEFTPPTLKEVQDYVDLKGLKINPKNFIEFFTESNWIDTKGRKVTNWKLKILTWNSYESATSKSEGKSYSDQIKELYGG